MCPWHQRPESAPPGSPNYPVPCGRVSRQPFALSPRGFLWARTCTFLIRLSRVDPLGGHWEQWYGMNMFDSLPLTLIYQPLYPADVMFASCFLLSLVRHTSTLAPFVCAHLNPACVVSAGDNTRRVYVWTDLQHRFTVLEAELKGRVSFLGCSAIPPENGLLIRCVLAFLKCYY